MEEVWKSGGGGNWDTAKMLSLPSARGGHL